MTEILFLFIGDIYFLLKWLIFRMTFYLTFEVPRFKAHFSGGRRKNIAFGDRNSQGKTGHKSGGLLHNGIKTT